MISDVKHFDLEYSHLNQTIFWGVKETGMLKEHGITRHSPAGAVISSSGKETQNPPLHVCLKIIDEPVKMRHQFA